MRDEEDTAELQIILGLILNDAFAKRFVESWDPKYLQNFQTPGHQLVVRVCLDWFQEYGETPKGDVRHVLEAKLPELSAAEQDLLKAEARELEDELATRYHQIDNGDRLYALMLAYFDKRTLGRAVDGAAGYLGTRTIDRVQNDRALGAFGSALQGMVASDDGRVMIAAAGESIEAAASGDLSRARVAAWRVATVGSEAEQLFDPWGDPEPPPFDLGLLPPVLQHFVIVRSKAMGVQYAPLAWSALGSCSAALDSSLHLQLKSNDRHYTVPPGIWLLLVGNPSSRKSPVLKVAFAPLAGLQTKRIRNYEQSKRQWEREDEATRGPVPRLEQLYTKDQTPEGVRDLLVGQDRGVIVYNDELSHFIGSMGRYSGGRDAGAADRAFYNTAYDGGPYISNRAGRKGGERIIVANLQVTVLAGAQPDVLRQFNRNNALMIDGMLQRVCPILMGKSSIDSDTHDTTRQDERYDRLIRRLARVEGNRTIQFTSAAQDVRSQVTRDLFPYEQLETWGQGFSTAIGKLNGLYGRLALTLAHVLSPREPPLAVGEKAAVMAQRLVFESLIPNMVRFYEMMGAGGDIETTRAIAAYLLREQRARVTATDIVHHVSAVHNLKTDLVRDALSPLINYGWLTPEGEDERRARAWVINPAIYVQFAERAIQARAQAVLDRTIMAQTLRPIAGATFMTFIESGEEQPKGVDAPFMTFIAREELSKSPSDIEANQAEVPPAEGALSRARNKGHKYEDSPPQSDVPAVTPKPMSFREKVCHNSTQSRQRWIDEQAKSAP